MRTLLIITLATILSCQNQKVDESKANSDDPCDRFMGLNGSYKHAAIEGTLLWTGTLSGTVEFAGSGYNDMICTYEIEDCVTGAITMQCNGADFPTTVEIDSTNSILLNATRYIRL